MPQSSEKLVVSQFWAFVNAGSFDAAAELLAEKIERRVTYQVEVGRLELAPGMTMSYTDSPLMSRTTRADVRARLDELALRPQGRPDFVIENLIPMGSRVVAAIRVRFQEEEKLHVADPLIFEFGIRAGRIARFKEEGKPQTIVGALFEPHDA